MSLSPRLQPLLAPAAYPHPVERVELVETPISWVLLTGRLAYKIKRPVRLEYVDQRTLQRRAQLCAEELRLNRRFAPGLYLGVRAIRRVDGHLRIDGENTGHGEVIEHAVCMRQFERSQELDRLVGAGGVSAAELSAFGRELAVTHAGLAAAPPSGPWGAPERIRALLLENLEQCAHAARPLGSSPRIEALRAPLERLLEANATLLAERRTAGRIRECHGDLHTRNIVREAGRLQAFDCMEFEPAFRWIDVADDVAFLVADLETLGAPRLAWAFLQAWLEESGDWQACRLLPLYQAHRALVRAKVAALSRGTDAAAATALRRAHEAHLAHAAAALQARRPWVLLMCGLSASGKSWLAARLAPEIGALHLRSDLERKRAAGLAPLAASDSGVQRALYAPEVTAALYARLLSHGTDVIAGGRSLLVDATFLDARHRRAWRELAAARGLPFRLIHCSAPETVLRQRIVERHARGTDASEADLGVLDWQLRRATPFEETERDTLIEADTTRADVVEATLRALRACGAD